VGRAGAWTRGARGGGRTVEQKKVGNDFCLHFVLFRSRDRRHKEIKHTFPNKNCSISAHGPTSRAGRKARSSFARSNSLVIGSARLVSKFVTSRAQVLTRYDNEPSSSWLASPNEPGLQQPTNSLIGPTSNHSLITWGTKLFADYLIPLLVVL
jgi:hypothetical protein